MAFGDLTTLADVKAWLQTGQAAFPATDDALLTRLVTAASQYIQTWLNRGIASADFLEVRDGTGGCRLQFACFPATAVLSLTFDGQAVPAATSFHASVARRASSGWMSSITGVPTRSAGCQPRFAQDGDAYTIAPVKSLALVNPAIAERARRTVERMLAMG